MTPTLNVVDTSGWLEYMTGGPNAGVFAPPVEATDSLVVPAISIMEVFRWVLRERGEGDALQVAAVMQQGMVVDLDDPLAPTAARVGLRHTLPLADSVILAMARTCDALLWTQDADFEGILNVEYRAKGKPGISG